MCAQALWHVCLCNLGRGEDVAGSAAIYIDPADPAGAADAIASALTRREHWRQASLNNAVRFSTKAMIGAYARWYHQVAQQAYFSVDEQAVQKPTGGGRGS